jgi:glutathione peroxidase
MNDTAAAPRSAYDFEATSITGQAIPLSDYRGKVLQALHEQYGERGLVVLGFPCNQFGSQEKGSESEIASFCDLNFGVRFPLMAKIDVNGANAHPLYRWLTAEAPGVLGTKAIKWNFTKFLVGRDGQVIRRYAPQDAPAKLAKDIDSALAL